MSEAKWLEEEVFEEVAAEATSRMKNRAERVMCTRESNWCTECGRCQDEDLDAEARSNYQREAFDWRGR